MCLPSRSGQALVLGTGQLRLIPWFIEWPSSFSWDTPLPQGTLTGQGALVGLAFQGAGPSGGVRAGLRRVPGCQAWAIGTDAMKAWAPGPRIPASGAGQQSGAAPGPGPRGLWHATGGRWLYRSWLGPTCTLTCSAGRNHRPPRGPMTCVWSQPPHLGAIRLWEYGCL